MANVIEVRNLCKVFYPHMVFFKKKHGIPALNDVTFSISHGEILGLVGESGCGKTTLARCILLLEEPTSGEIFIDQKKLYSTGEHPRVTTGKLRHSFQIVFQDPNSSLNPKRSVYAAIEEGLINRGLSKKHREKKIIELLQQVGIPPNLIYRKPYIFSGGQKQRIALARALAMEPQFIVLDEPVSNLDVSIQAQIINLLLDLKNTYKLTYLFISHDLALVSYVSDRIAVMKEGRIVEIGLTKDIIGSPTHPYTQQLFQALPELEISPEAR